MRVASSLITKKRIAKAFKSLLKDRDFDKISVVDIMDLAGIRRQTFYNHFLDKYELLDWIFETELQEQVTDNLTYISGVQLLEEVCRYMDSHRYFYKQAFAIKGQNNFSSFFLAYCLQVIQKLVQETLDQRQGQLEASHQDFLVTYHAHALLSLIKAQAEGGQGGLLSQFPQLLSVILTSIPQTEV